MQKYDKLTDLEILELEAKIFKAEAAKFVDGKLWLLSRKNKEWKATTFSRNLIVSRYKSYSLNASAKLYKEIMQCV